MASRFKINLHDAHIKSGLTIYAVAKSLDMNFNTVNKYVSKNLTVERLSPEVKKLAAFYGLSWTDPSVVEIVETDEDESQTKSLLAVPAL